MYYPNNKGHEIQKQPPFSDSLTLKTNVLGSSETTVAVFQSTSPNISKQFNILLVCSLSLEVNN